MENPLVGEDDLLLSAGWIWNLWVSPGEGGVESLLDTMVLGNVPTPMDSYKEVVCVTKKRHNLMRSRSGSVPYGGCDFPPSSVYTNAETALVVDTGVVHVY